MDAIKEKLVDAEFNFLFKAVYLKEFFDLKKKTLKMSFSVDPSDPGEPGDEDLDN